MDCWAEWLWQGSPYGHTCSSPSVWLSLWESDWVALSLLFLDPPVWPWVYCGVHFFFFFSHHWPPQCTEERHKTHLQWHSCIKTDRCTLIWVVIYKGQWTPCVHVWVDDQISWISTLWYNPARCSPTVIAIINQLMEQSKIACVVYRIEDICLHGYNDTVKIRWKERRTGFKWEMKNSLSCQSSAFCWLILSPELCFYWSSYTALPVFTLCLWYNY